jgi:hypothetical protein
MSAVSAIPARALRPKLSNLRQAISLLRLIEDIQEMSVPLPSMQLSMLIFKAKAHR